MNPDPKKQLAKDYQELTNDLGQYVPPQWMDSPPAKKEPSELETKLTPPNDK